MKKRTSAVFKSFMNLTTKPVVLALVCLSFDLLDFFSCVSVWFAFYLNGQRIFLSLLCLSA